jgi:ribonuclease Z
MPSLFVPELVNGVFGDPALYVDLNFEGRALLLDLGDLSALPPKKILRVSDAFVTHAHMDHFGGFDRLLRIDLGRDNAVRLYGPPGFIERVEHKLSAYTWNLVANYPTDFTLLVNEFDGDETLRRARFRCHNRFAREALDPQPAPDGMLRDEPSFRVRATLLDHDTPCLGIAIEERTHVNVLKSRLHDMGLEVGPWLNDLKREVLSGAPDGSSIRAQWRENGELRERWCSLGELRAQALRLEAGRKLCYVTDVVYHADNERRIAALAADADLLFIESVFLEDDAGHAARKFHLTARQAGRIARAARAKTVISFHFSPRYMGREDELRAELEAARCVPIT